MGAVARFELNIATPYDKRLLWIAAVLVVALIAVGDNGEYEWKILFICASILLLLWLLRALSMPTRVVMDTAANKIELYYRAWVFRPPKTLELEPFNKVRSYIRGAGASLTVFVEIATSEALPRTISMGVFEGTYSEESKFLTIPRPIEPSPAAELRKRLASTGKFVDEGFLGDFYDRRADEIA